MHLGISAAFSTVKDELSEHLDAINHNTQDIEALHQRLHMIESMIEKLAERIDHLDMAKAKETLPAEKISLSLREQELFLTLYTATELYSASEYARYLALTEELVHALAHKLISKGIPVLKETDEIGRICYFLDDDFKNRQAKNNLVPISKSILEQFQLREDDIDNNLF